MVKGNMKILAINPGSTSTKIGLYDDLNKIFVKTLRHTVEELAPFHKIIDQYEFRRNIILKALEEEKVDVKSIDAVVGRGGLVKPIPGGVYRVHQALLEDLKKETMGEHASNLGAFIAHEIAVSSGKPDEAFIVDPVVVDEMDEIARFSGLPQLPRVSIFHALNQKAVARRFAHESGKKYEELNLVVVHLGGGISVGAHQNGRVIDVNNALNGEGPFSPERAGTLPVLALTQMCFSGEYTLAEVKKLIMGKGGIVAYLNTNDAKAVEDKCLEGDKESLAVYEAMAYQIAKEIGAASTVLKGKIDAILITGGLAYSDLIVNWLKERCSFIAPIKVYPGEDEIIALVESVYYAYKGEIQIKEYN